MNTATDFITTCGGERVDTRLHRIAIVDASCAPEGGEPHVPALAATEPKPGSGLWSSLAASLAIVAICCAVATVGFTMALPKPKADLPRAAAKVTT